MTSHWENNYQGSVKTLNGVRSRLGAALLDTEAPPALYGSLKREELYRTGSVVLHEIYFDGLGGDGQAAGAVRDAITLAFGSFATWEPNFAVRE
jgi:Fe-Mn family superoxide dismutase